MASSGSLLSAQIQFLDAQLALIHIPLDLYPSFLQALLKLLVPIEPYNEDESSTEHATDVRSRRPWDYEHPFINISVTPVECSVACSRSLAQRLFAPARDNLPEHAKKRVSISHEDYVVMQIDGEGLDAGQRVLELTSPLAMARISIFFITTYFSDYILVPMRSRQKVIQALEERGFIFEKSAEAYINAQHHRNSSSTSFDAIGRVSGGSTPSDPPSTPPPTSVSELQVRTFALLKRHSISPVVDPSIQLIQCAGRKDSRTRHGSSSDGISGGGLPTAKTAAGTPAEDKMYLALVKCLITPPRFLSITLTDTEPASLLLERALLPHFATASGESVLLRNEEDIQIPLILDLAALPMESTGIVCGVAGRLVGATRTGMLGEPAGPVEMSYLSTAKSGAVMVAQEELGRALEALRGAEENGVPH